MDNQGEDDYNYYDEEYAMDTGNLHEEEYEFIQADEFEKKREELISNFIEFSSLSHDEAELVLINFNWNLEKLQGVWYDNLNKIKEESGISRTQISIKKTKQEENQTSCLVCFDDLTQKNKIGLKCNHFFCKSCFADHIITKINEDPLTCLTMHCPQANCSLVIPSSIVKQVLSTDQDSNKETSLTTYKKYLLKNFTDSNADIKWCPNPKCGQCVRLPGHGMKEIHCICNTVFCFKCLRGTHRPCDCEMMDVWEKKHKTNSEDLKWITENTKQCPKCGGFIQKNQGCNHMTCKCKHEFCWICLGDWKIHDNNFYNCLFQDKPKGYKRTKGDKTSGVKETERFVRFCALYENHKKGIEFAERQTKLIDEYQDSLRKKGIDYFQVLFLNEALITVINARRILMSTYIFAYFRKDSNRNKLFEHNQGLLDSQTDLLHEMIENKRYFPEVIETVNPEEFKKKFTDLRGKIVNRIGVIKNYQENLLKETENSLANVIDYSRYKV